MQHLVSFRTFVVVGSGIMAQNPLQLREVLNTARLTLTLFNPTSQQHSDLLFPVILYLMGTFVDTSLPPDEHNRAAHEIATQRMQFYRESGRIDSSLLGGRQPTTAALWMVRLGANNPDGECIGVASVLYRAYIPDQGWAILPAHQGRGYATEVCAEVLRYFQQELNLSELMVMIEAKNTQSNRVAKKLGYVLREGGLANEDGTVVDLLTLPGASLPPEGSRLH